MLFLLAGLSDAADGYLAKRYGWRTELGAYLDPIADKALLVSIYVTLGFAGHLPAWLVIAVVSRDILIVGAVVLSWMLSRPMSLHPILVSKANTFSQIVLAGLVLAELGLGLGLEQLVAVWSGSLARSPSSLPPPISGRGSGIWRAMSRARAPLPSRKRKPAPLKSCRALGGQGDVNVAQLTLDLPHRAALGAEDFLVSDCNLAAVRLIDAWPEWQGNVQLLIGPAASGKTHLARVWQARSGATRATPASARYWSDRCDGRGDGAGGRGYRSRTPMTRRHCSISSTSRARRASSCCSPRARPLRGLDLRRFPIFCRG